MLKYNQGFEKKPSLSLKPADIGIALVF